MHFSSASRGFRLSLLSLLTALLFAGCGGDSSAGDGGASDAATDAGSGRDASLPGDCTDEANKKVFVLVTDLEDAVRPSHLMRFDPEALTYTDIGLIDCALDGDFLRSMAVDRNGTAWVSTSRGALFAVDTTTAACRATGLATGQEQVHNYGMGFATVGDTSQEKLFITAEGGWWMDGLAYRRLLTIDLPTLTLSLVGDIEAPTPANMELTGTGDGRLFGMVLDVRNLRNIIVSIERLDPDTGGTLERKVVPFDPKAGFAFAQWGGHFWLFSAAPDGSARVAEYDFAAGSVVQTVDTSLDVTGTIVGAGVSTCAPYDLI
jgi:hypothetical protein